MDFVVMDWDYYQKMVKKCDTFKKICCISVTFLIFQAIVVTKLDEENVRLKSEKEAK